MAVELWETLKQAIINYTGLSPATFFTGIAISLALYYFISGLFGSSPSHQNLRSFEEPMEPLPPPIQVGEISDKELKHYDGSDPKKPLLMAIKGQIYDVSQSRMFYGPGGPYALFAGKDVSRALAKMSFEEVDLTGDISGLGPFELEALQDWEFKFMSKYTKVGTIKGNGSSPSEPKSAEATDHVHQETDELADGGSSEKPVDEPMKSTSTTANAETKDE